jgi:hypothetical protein
MNPTSAILEPASETELLEESYLDGIKNLPPTPTVFN